MSHVDLYHAISLVVSIRMATWQWLPWVKNDAQLSRRAFSGSLLGASHLVSRLYHPSYFSGLIVLIPLKSLGIFLPTDDPPGRSGVWRTVSITISASSRYPGIFLQEKDEIVEHDHWHWHLPAQVEFLWGVLGIVEHFQTWMADYGKSHWNLHGL